MFLLIALGILLREFSRVSLVAAVPLPNEEEIIDGWHSDPPGRGSLTIITSCVSVNSQFMRLDSHSSQHITAERNSVARVQEEHEMGHLRHSGPGIGCLDRMEAVWLCKSSIP